MVLNIKFLILLLIFTIWEMTWKGIGLWKAGKNDHLIWFIAILVFNTAGILPIIYIFLDKRRNNGRRGISKKKSIIKKKVVKGKGKK